MASHKPFGHAPNNLFWRDSFSVPELGAHGELPSLTRGTLYDVPRIRSPVLIKAVVRLRPRPLL